MIYKSSSVFSEHLTNRIIIINIIMFICPMEHAEIALQLTYLRCYLSFHFKAFVHKVRKEFYKQFYCRI